MHLKMLAVAVCLTTPIAGAAWAQGGGPVNPGSGPTAGGTVDTGPAAGTSSKMMKKGSKGAQPQDAACAVACQSAEGDGPEARALNSPQLPGVTG